MVKSKGSKDSSEREKWNKVFNAMVHMLRTQQTQLESLAKDRKLLEDRIKLQYDRWVSDVNLFQDQITQMKNEFTVQEMQAIVEAAKADFVTGLKQREAFVYKRRFENADSELADFRDWFNYLSDKCSGQKDLTLSTSNRIEEQHKYNSLESELGRLQCEYEKLTLDRNSDISALLAQKNFIWNQYNRMEKDLNEQLRQKDFEIECANDKIHRLLASMEELQSSNTEKDQMLLNEQLRQKHDEIECANDKIHRLLASMEELQSSNTEKDQMLLKLENNLAKLKSESAEKDNEISRLSKELEVSRKSRDVSVTPVLRRCTAESRSFRLKGKSSNVDGRTAAVKKEVDSSSIGTDKGCRSSKRKAVEIIDISSDTPRLFTSSFRVPKLKSSSPCVNC